MTDTARMRKYAEWLVANKDKSGTPQFQTVANAYKQLRSAPAQQTEQPNQSFVGALQYGLDAPLENIATTAKAVGMDGVGNFLSNLTDAPQNYASASEEFINQGGDGYKLTALPRAVVEQGAQFAGSLAARAGGGAIGGAIGSVAAGGGAVPGAAIGFAAGPALFEAIQVLGPVAMERAKNNGRDKPNASDWQGAIATASASGTLNALAPGFQGLVKRVGVEAATEGLQSVVQQTGETALTEAGLEVSPKQAIGEGIIGGGAAGGVTGVTQTLTKVTETGERIFRPQEELTERQKQGMASFANRLLRIAEREGLDLENVDTRSDKGAKQALTFGEGEVRNEIDTVMDQLKDKKVREEMGMDDAEYRRIKTGVYQAKGKQRDIVPEETIDFVTGRFGDTQIGQELTNAFIESNSATQLNREGTIGGFSQFVNGFLPWSRTASPITTISRAAAPAIGLATGGATGLVTAVAAPLAVVGVANTIDKITGRKSKIARFTRKNKDNETLPTPDGRDVVAEVKARQEAEQLAKEQAKQASAEEAARRRAQIEAEKLARKTERLAKQAERAETQAEKDRLAAQVAANNVRLVRIGARPIKNSPRGKAFAALKEERNALSKRIRKAHSKGDLSHQQLDEIIRLALLAEAASNPDVAEAAKTYLGHLETGVFPKDGSLSVALAAIKLGLSKIDGIEEMVPKAKKKKKQKGQTQGQSNIPVTPRSAAVQAGIEANQRAMNELKMGLEADETVSEADKVPLRKAQEDLTDQLSGSPQDIIAYVNGIADKARAAVSNPALVDQFVMPYVTRVTKQQLNRMKTGETTDIDDDGNDGGNQGGSGPVGPVQGPSGPVQGPSGPILGPNMPVQGPSGPVEGPRGPVEGPIGRPRPTKRDVIEPLFDAIQSVDGEEGIGADNNMAIQVTLREMATSVAPLLEPGKKKTPLQLEKVLRRGVTEARRNGADEHSIATYIEPTISKVLALYPKAVYEPGSVRPIPVNPNVPSAAQIIEGVKAGEQLLEIGKKGTAFEYGIQDFDQAVALASALGFTVRLFNSHSAFLKTYGNTKDTRDALGFFSNGYSRRPGYEGTIVAMREHGSIARKKDVHARMLTLLHEIGHGLAKGNVIQSRDEGRLIVDNPLNKTQNMVSNQSFEGVFADLLKDPNNEIVQEVIAAQKQFVRNRDGGEMRLRPDGLEKSYLHSVAELTTDMIWPFLMDPKGAQEIMPKATALVRETFNNLENSKIRFYEVDSPAAFNLSPAQLDKRPGVKKTEIAFTAVLGIVVAMALAGLAAGEEEEESQGILAA